MQDNQNQGQVQGQGQRPTDGQNDQGDYYYKPGDSLEKKSKGKSLVIAGIVLLVIIGFVWWFVKKDNEDRAGKQIEVNNENGGPDSVGPANTGEVSPITGLPCENWNRRPIAVMQPSDPATRPTSGFSEADMVIEMPVITATITRLMGIYICNDPEDVGSMRSARHDFVHLARGLDAIFAHWGRSQMDWFISELNNGVIDNINCNNDAGKSSNKYCYRHPDLVGMHSGYMKFAQILQASEDYGYRMENQFSGYSHEEEAPLDQRPESGNLRVGFAGAGAVNYDYDKDSNSYLRIWGGEPDTDRNNGKRIAPRNVVVMMAKSEQIEGQYNNVQLGDPWMDESDSGEAYYYINGKETKGSWKKDKLKIDSKLLFLDQNGKEVKFIPGQIWVEILEPGQGLKWKTSAQPTDQAIQ